MVDKLTKILYNVTHRQLRKALNSESFWVLIEFDTDTVYNEEEEYGNG